MLSCAITGHRPAKLHLENENSPACVRLKQAIHQEFMSLYRKGVRHFYLGGALGVDLWSGELLLSMKEQEGFGDIELTLALPFEGHDLQWRACDRERLEQLRLGVSRTVVVCGKEVPPSLCYRRRNLYLVEHADCLLAVYDTSMPRSGTGMTVRYGEKKGIPIIFIHPGSLRQHI